jgi:dihydroxyacetone kinase-like protein
MRDGGESIVLTLPAARLIRMFGRIARDIEAEKDRLSMLDGAIGDADHGTTMALGFRSVEIALRALDPSQATPSDVFQAAGTAFLDAVGASTGPLYASGFLCAAGTLSHHSSLEPSAQVAILVAIAHGISTRGKSQRGDKTMLDAWIPAAEAGNAALRSNVATTDLWASIAEAAERGAEETRSMIAVRGRATRVGQRSLGHLDPGAASAAIIIRAMQAEFGT